MRKLLILLIFALLLASCATIKTTKKDVADCMKDPDCVVEESADWLQAILDTWHKW